MLPIFFNQRGSIIFHRYLAGQLISDFFNCWQLTKIHSVLVKFTKMKLEILKMKDKQIIQILLRSGILLVLAGMALTTTWAWPWKNLGNNFEFVSQHNQATFHSTPLMSTLTMHGHWKKGAKVSILVMMVIIGNSSKFFTYLIICTKA